MGSYCSLLTLSTSVNFLCAINMPDAYVRHEPQTSRANRMWYEGGNVLKQLSKQGLKVCCSGHMVQCLISHRGRTWLS